MSEKSDHDLLIEMHQDIKWIKEWISTQNKYKLLVYGALITALISLVK